VTTIEDFEAAMRTMDAALRPIAKTPLVDLKKPGWTKRLPTGAPQPYCPALEQTGIREDADRIVDAIIAYYATASDADREHVRTLFRAYDSFRWAAGWGLLSPAEPINTDQLRKALLLFSIKDQGADWRDAIVILERICAMALRTSLPLAETLTEVAALSSDEARFRKFKMSRSTRTLLLDYSGRMEPVRTAGS
jgi:hypothetical protein